MKNILPIFILFCTLGFGQNNAPMKAPVITVKLKLGEKIKLGETTIVFSEVISDSRCPKGTTCVWPGEAKVLLKLKGNASASEEVVLVLKPSAEQLIFQNEKMKVLAHSLEPYPEAGSKIDPQQYFLRIYSEENKG